MSTCQSTIDENTCSGSLTRHLVDELDEIVFVCDPDTYDLLYLNDFGKKAFNIESFSGKKCHEALFGHSTPCSFCKKKYLSLDDFYVWEQPVDANRHYLIRDKLILMEGRTLLFGIANNIIEKEIQPECPAQTAERTDPPEMPSGTGQSGNIFRGGRYHSGSARKAVRRGQGLYFRT